MLRVRDRYVIGLPSHSSPDTDGGWEEEDKNVLPLLSLNFSMHQGWVKKERSLFIGPMSQMVIYAHLSNLRFFVAFTRF